MVDRNYVLAVEMIPRENVKDTNASHGIDIGRRKCFSIFVKKADTMPLM